MQIIIRDARERPIAIRENGTMIDRLYNHNKTQLIATYNKTTKATYLSNGRLVGRGDLLLTQIR